MKTICLSVYLVFSISVIGLAQELPNDVQDVLAKLDEFEAKERAKFEEVVQAKRNAVSKFLQQSLARETKAGNLDAALLIKKKIESLSPPKPTASNSNSGGEPEGELEFLGKWSWIHEGQSLTIEKNGKAFITLPNGKITAEWKQDSETSISIEWGRMNSDTRDSRGNITFDTRRNKASFEGDDRGNRREFSMEKL